MLPQDVADILVRRFYCRRLNGFTSPKYCVPLLDAAEIGWVSVSKTRVQIFPMRPKILELSREDTSILEPQVARVNWCFTFLRPVFDPGLSLNELRLLARIGVVLRNVDEL